MDVAKAFILWRTKTQAGRRCHRGHSILDDRQRELEGTALLILHANSEGWSGLA
jgi:hypothetical protein